MDVMEEINAIMDTCVEKRVQAVAYPKTYVARLEAACLLIIGAVTLLNGLDANEAFQTKCYNIPCATQEQNRAKGKLEDLGGDSGVEIRVALLKILENRDFLPSVLQKLRDEGLVMESLDVEEPSNNIQANAIAEASRLHCFDAE